MTVIKLVGDKSAIVTIRGRKVLLTNADVSALIPGRDHYFVLAVIVRGNATIEAVIGNEEVLVLEVLPTEGFPTGLTLY